MVKGWGVGVEGEALKPLCNQQAHLSLGPPTTAPHVCARVCSTLFFTHFSLCREKY